MALTSRTGKGIAKKIIISPSKFQLWMGLNWTTAPTISNGAGNNAYWHLKIRQNM